MNSDLRKLVSSYVRKPIAGSPFIYASYPYQNAKM